MKRNCFTEEKGYSVPTDCATGIPPSDLRQASEVHFRAARRAHSD
jgi:hypothetical protein